MLYQYITVLADLKAMMACRRLVLAPYHLLIIAMNTLSDSKTTRATGGKPKAIPAGEAAVTPGLSSGPLVRLARSLVHNVRL